MGSTTHILPLRCGTIRAPATALEVGGVGELTLPVYAYLIAHSSGRTMLFDAGLAPSHHDQTVSKVFRNQLPEGHDVAARLVAAGFDPARVEGIVASHSHYDHIGGVALVPNARIFIHHKEELGGELDTGQDLVRTGDSLDLFGDGSVEVFATPGHTCGHQSLRVWREGGADILAGDACYFCRSLARDDTDQPYPFDKALYVETKRRLARMRAGGDFVIPGHDESFLDNIPRGSAIRAGPLSRL